MSRIDILVTLRDDAVSICIFCKILESISDKLDSLIWWPLRRKTFFLEVMNYFRFFGKHHWHSLPECPNTTKERNAFGTDMVVALRQKEGISDGRLFFFCEFVSSFGWWCRVLVPFILEWCTYGVCFLEDPYLCHLRVFR